jgi:regulator of protease activity HflC (stomatin/prohibitin superfamily)
MSVMPTELVFATVGLVIVGLGVRIVRENERLAVLRLGRFNGVRGPGLVWIVPLVDKAIRVDLDREVPGARSLTPEQLALEIERRVGASRL